MSREFINLRIDESFRKIICVERKKIKNVVKQSDNERVENAENYRCWLQIFTW